MQEMPLAPAPRWTRDTYRDAYPTSKNNSMSTTLLEENGFTLNAHYGACQLCAEKGTTHQLTAVMPDGGGYGYVQLCAKCLTRVANVALSYRSAGHRAEITIDQRVTMLERLLVAVAAGVLAHEYCKDLYRDGTEDALKAIVNDGDFIKAITLFRL